MLLNAARSLEVQKESFERRIDQLEQELRERNHLEPSPAPFQTPIASTAPTDIRKQFDTTQIYERAAEWLQQLTLAQQLNNRLEKRIQDRDQELLALSGEVEKLQSSFEKNRRALQKELRQYQDLCMSLQLQEKARDSEKKR